MGMYATKNSSDDGYSIDTKWLKKYDYFCGFKYGGIKWTNGWGHEASISFSVDTSFMNSPNIRFQYSTSRYGGEKKEMDYSFPLVKVPCNLGGSRWAFQCTLCKNGRYCGRTVYTLYQAGSDYFGCRHCMSIVYESQRHSRSKFEYFGKILDSERKACELRKTIHKRHYKGRPTRKVRRLRRLEKRIPPTGVIAELEMNLLRK